MLHHLVLCVLERLENEVGVFAAVVGVNETERVQGAALRVRAAGLLRAGRGKGKE